MNGTFGIEEHPRSTKWDDVRKGPSAEAVLQHLRKVVHYKADEMESRAGMRR